MIPHPPFRVRLRRAIAFLVEYGIDRGTLEIAFDYVRGPRE